MSLSTTPLFFIVAGETSGDRLAAGLIKQLRVHYPEARFQGVTGPCMRRAGCDSVADIEQLSLFGVSEVLAQIPRLLKLRRALYGRVINLAPAAFIGVDAPAFNTGLEKRVKKAGIKTVHYVCPTVWAWREGRVRTLRRASHMLLAIFPFEPKYFARHGIPVTFVGHPLADEWSTVSKQAAARALGLDRGKRWVGLLPGSRLSEIHRLGPRFIETARWLHKRDPNIGFVVPMASARVRQAFEAILADDPTLDVVLVDGQARQVMRAAEVLLIASGTATLEALLSGTPMVVSYELSSGNYWLARLLRLIKTRYVSMPNLLAERRLVPELLQSDAQPPVLGAWLYHLLHSSVARHRQMKAFESLHATLVCGADARAARAIAGLIGKEE